MGLLGKYTTYVGGVATDAHKLLAKLFPGSPFATPLTQGDEAAAQKLVIAIATAKVVNGVGGLQPSDGVQAGDLGMFPQGVDLTYAYGVGQVAPAAPPDVSTVKWTKAGDPANPYIPDITSPVGLGTDASDKSVDPGISVADAQAIATTEDTTGANVRNPVADGPSVFKNSVLGNPQKLGDSGGNV
jgi:hypothetical protein